jgi:hypothetical protein
MIVVVVVDEVDDVDDDVDDVDDVDDEVVEDEVVVVVTAPACVTVKVTPAITRVPVRDACPVLAVAVYWTEAAPDPLAGVTVSQAANDCAVQGQAASVPMTTCPDVAVAGTCALAGESV